MSAPVGVPIAAAPMDPGVAIAGPGLGGARPNPQHPGGDKKRKAPPTGPGQPTRKDRPSSMTEEDSAAASNPQSTANSGTATPAPTAAVPRAREAKRTRVHFSCVECHRRKQKCDRKEPCSQCVARRVPHLCRPFLNGVEDPNANSDVHARLTTIEGMLARLTQVIPQAIQGRGFNDASSPDVSSLPSGEDVFHPQSGPQQEPPRQAYAHKPPPSGLFPASLSTSTPVGRSGYGWGLREGRMINLTVEDNAELRDVLLTLRESGITKNHLEWLIAGVPGRRMADALVEMYFRDIDWTRYKINRPQFERRYQAFFDSIGRNPSNPKLDADTIKWIPLMFIVKLAIAALSASSDVMPGDEQQAWSRRFYGSARSGLEYAKALQRDNLDVLFAGLLASRYMLLTRRPAEGSTPLTTAFQLGLYRDGTVLNLADKREVEIRRRAWAMLYHLDRTISLLVGRPASISDAHTDARPPANLDDDEIEGDFDPAGHPMTTPTVYTYVIVRHKLAEIMGRIAYHTFTIQLPDYQTVLALDKELLAWRSGLPPFLAMINPDTSFDQTHPYLFVQRHLLACEWYYTRITLNRPYLLRRKPQDGRYEYSRNAAIESATADLLSRRAFIMEKGDLIINSGGYRVLNSYMVLGVTIKLDPESPQADELRHLLNVVSGRARDEQGSMSEPIVKEELAIVEFLTAKNPSKAQAAVANGAQNGAARTEPSDENTPVDLLLGLAKTNSGRRAAEEEKRQLRLQQAREQEEQRQARRRVMQQANGSGVPNPWNYVPPQMPGLDVHQPFGARRPPPQLGSLPRPLQPPSQREEEKLNTSWSPENPFGFTDRSSPGFGNPNNMMQGFQGQVNLSPYQEMGILPGPGPGPGLSPSEQLALQGAGSAANANNNNNPNNTANNNNAVESNGHSLNFGTGQEFGSAVDNFDFSAFGGPHRGVEMAFNPFAIQQTGDEGSGSEPGGQDDETTFLNFILTKFANSSGETM
ncbi:uncharacterized protein CcaverHIS019_0201320 [Cutaneotrichosporon cavernicola]|uniref:Zn(2)-C6 fungal-type domain-containing protein n=1 Tax=Cutaneotrichosporon cavernicola TaxID=279322 RepID=A0AA48I804_9TREE|nr:uncharacterized protein CcaverHIS019_0201320 [Cutaneotrichosporon cavernicola]BEI88770.1 hypothetical protein CcaverHIS019_0201320 [Cutaneotrichosporon cavernicola]